MFNFLKKYHYVPPCPRCGSLKTGRYICLADTYSGIERIIGRNYQKGELTKIIHGFDNYEMPNLYCEECGIEWRGRVEELPLTNSRIIEESKKRGITNQTCTDMLNYKKIVKQKKKEEKRAAKKQKKAEKKMKRKKKK